MNNKIQDVNLTWVRVVQQFIPFLYRDRVQSVGKSANESVGATQSKHKDATRLKFEAF